MIGYIPLKIIQKRDSTRLLFSADLSEGSRFHSKDNDLISIIMEKNLSSLDQKRIETNRLKKILLSLNFKKTGAWKF